MLQDRPIRNAIQISARGYTARVDSIIRELDNHKQQSIRQDLQTFAGFKTYHHLCEVVEKARRDDGTLKSWKEFQDDTRGIDNKYNRNWLRSEYAFIQSSAQMAELWEQYAKWGDTYDLLYKTAGDEQVRADHARLDGMCLPFSDPAWDSCFPPNGWGCRCHVIQVIPGSHPRSNSDEMIKVLEEITDGKQEIFRFNPGKQGRLTPPKHPYYGKNGYDHCKTTKLARKLDPNEECEILNNLLAEEIEFSQKIKQRKKEYHRLKNDPNYKEIEFNEENGGLRATNIRHNTDKEKGWYETKVQEIGYLKGHSVILEREIHTEQNIKNNDGTWDGKYFEIGAIEKGTSANYRNQLKHCASKPNVQVAVLFVLKGVELDEFKAGLKRYNGLKGTSQWKAFDEIILITEDGRLYKVKAQLSK